MTAAASFSVTNARAVVGATCFALLIISVVRPSPGVAVDQSLQAAIVDPSAPSTLFVHAGGERWFQPLAVYPSRWLLRAGASPELALRLPAMVAGALTLVCAYAFAVKTTHDIAVGALAVVLLIAMPGFRVAAQTPGAELLLVPLVLAWLVTVFDYLERPRVWLPCAGGAVLGVCLYTQPVGVLAVPIFLALGAVIMRRAPGGNKAGWASLAGVIVVTLPASIWVVLHREAYLDTFGRWAVHAAHIRSPWDGIVAFTRWAVMARRVEEYWHYFNPTFLFGGSMFGLPLVVLVPVGVWMMAEKFSRNERVAVLGGMLSAPVAAVLLDVPRRPSLVWMLLPFGALAAAFAARAIVVMRGWRVAALGALLLLAFLSLTLASK